MATYDDFDDEEQYEEEAPSLTFDDMVSFTMFAEMSVVLFAAVIYLILLYFTL